MNRERAGSIFESTLSAMEEPEPLGQKLSHEFLHERFARVVVRDALHEIGVEFDIAESTAAAAPGTPRKRFWKCFDQLRLEAE